MTAAKIFYCYSDNDQGLRDQLGKHLSSLKRSGIVSILSDRNIQKGSSWKDETDQSIKNADILLLLVSPDFIASEYCYSSEMKEALKRHEQGTVRVIPILIRPTDIGHSPLSHLQALPENGQAIAGWRDQDEALSKVAQGIRKAVLEISSNPSQETSNNKLAYQIKGVGFSKQTGALIVYAHSKLLGKNIDLYEGSHTSGKLHSSTSIMQKKIGDRYLFLAIFSNLTPNTYTVFMDWKYYTRAIVSADNIVEIDWGKNSPSSDFSPGTIDHQREEGDIFIKSPSKHWWQFWKWALWKKW